MYAVNSSRTSVYDEVTRPLASFELYPLTINHLDTNLN